MQSVRCFIFFASFFCSLLLFPDFEFKQLAFWLESKNIEIDIANKNSSRLSRIPGFFRGDDMQYLVAREMGTKDWNEFERLYLNKKKTSEAVAEKENDIAELINEYGNFVERDSKGIPNKLNELFFAAYVVQKQKLAVTFAMRYPSIRNLIIMIRKLHSTTK